MITNQVLLNTIEGLKSISRIDFCVFDTEAKVLASTFGESKEFEDAILSFGASPADSQVIQGCQFFKIFDEQQLEYILLAGGESDDAYMVGKIAAFQIQNLLVAYKERFDKDNFIKNLLMDNLLLVDIYNRAKKLHLAQRKRKLIDQTSDPQAAVCHDILLHIEYLAYIQRQFCLFVRLGDFFDIIHDRTIGNMHLLIPAVLPQNGQHLLRHPGKLPAAVLLSQFLYDDDIPLVHSRDKILCFSSQKIAHIIQGGAVLLV